MLGYVRTYKPELKIKDYEAYRGIYCSLCRTLGSEYGVFARLLLSYDVTFLTVVLFSAANVSPCFKNSRCPFNPAKKCNYCTNSEKRLSYAAAVTVVMFYYKVRDNIADGGFFERLCMYLLLPYAAHLYKKAAKRFSQLDVIVRGATERQRHTESSGTDSCDRAAHESADALGKLFCFFDKDNLSLYRFGYAVGRWVFLLDAADDIEKDVKSGSFNVFVNKFSLGGVCDVSDEVRREIECTLNMSRAQALEACRNLKAVVFMPVIENIIFDGMGSSMNKVLKGNSKHEGSL